MYTSKSFYLILFILVFWCVGAVAQPRVLLKGDYPDPTIMRDGKDFYMTHSSCDYAPGILIWHSEDLVNWQPVCRVLTKYFSRVWAPDLQKVDGKYYLYFPSRRRIYVCTAENIKGPWSDPILVTRKGRSIDPGLIVTPQGKKYLFVNDGKMAPLNDEGTELTDTLRIVHRGWPIPRHWNGYGYDPQNPDKEIDIVLESPKLIYKDGYYYLTSAEGGTAGAPTKHMAVSARAKSLEGPWEESPYNPIVRTYDASESWWSKGHGTLIDDAQGRWWIVYHAYPKNAHVLGRYTLIEPVEWTEDGWWKVSDKKNPLGVGAEVQADPDNELTWTYYKEYPSDAVSFSKRKIVLKGKGSTAKNGRVLLMTAGDLRYDIQAKISINDMKGGTQAGLVLFYNEKAFSGVLVDGRQAYVYDNGNQLETYDLQSKIGAKGIDLRLCNSGDSLDIQVRCDNSSWTTLVSGLDISGMHHNKLKGFLALRPGLMVVGDDSAEFRNFKYKPKKIKKP